jgi:hypothetical protein
METLMNIVYLLLAAGFAVFIFLAYESRRQRPLAEFGKGMVQMALRYAPEQRAGVERRGSISRHQLAVLIKLNLKRIDAELQRRVAATN